MAREQPGQIEEPATMPNAGAPGAEANAGTLPDAPEIAGQQEQSISSPSGAPNSVPAAKVADNGTQTKRILYIIPNFRAVSADQHLPPQTVKEKFMTATLDSVDYSSFIFVGYRPESPKHATPRRSSIKAPRATEVLLAHLCRLR